MLIPLKITFRDIAPSPAIESNIREKAAKLDGFYDRVMSCHVIVEAPHRHHHKGKAYHARIHMTVPGGELVINRTPKRPATVKTPSLEPPPKELLGSHVPSKHGAHEDLYVAIRDAFNAAARKLQDHARRRRGKVKLHTTPAIARVAKLFPIEDFGFLMTPDGREVYFHKNSVQGIEFAHLKVGAQVRFAETMDQNGPHASSVRAAAGAVHNHSEA